MKTRNKASAISISGKTFKSNLFVFRTLLALILSTQMLFAYSGGDGSQNDPYQVSNTGDLNDLMFNSGDWNKYFILTDNINCSALGSLRPIGNPDTSFQGDFNGSFYYISNLIINLTDSSYVSLFGHIDGGKVYNLVLKDSEFSGNSYIGGLCGYNNGTITACKFYGNVTGSGDYVGSLCGYNSNIITYCHSSGEIEGSSFIGGFVGINDGGTITNCYSNGSVIGTVDRIGGLCGDNTGEIEECYSNCDTEGDELSGGFCGSNTSNIKQCYSTGSITGSGTNIGGFCGLNNSGNITNCFWDTLSSGKSLSSGGSGETTSDMRKQITFSNWDFDNIWYMPGRDYPKLEDMPLMTDPPRMLNANLGVCLIMLSWKASDTDSVKYNIYRRSNDEEYDYSDPLDTNISGTIYNDDQIELGKLYYYVVRADSSGRESWNSPEDSASTNITYSGGDGTPGDPYQISNFCDLFILMHSPLDWDKYFILTDSIDCSPIKRPVPIGNGSGSGNTTPFTGSFDGQQNVLFKIKMNLPGIDFVGLFGYNKGVIKKLGVEQCEFIGSNYVGSVCGWNDGKITDCLGKGAVTGSGYYVGGLCGWNEGDITSRGWLFNDLFYYCITDCRTEANKFVGGFCGWNEGLIENYISKGDVSGNDNIGGFCGRNQFFAGKGAIVDCKSEGTVTGRDSLGGFCGDNINAYIGKCESSGNVTGNEVIGGFCGRNFGKIRDCTSNGNAEGNENIGGFVGQNFESVILSCTAKGNANSTGNRVGGFCGFNYNVAPDSTAKIDSCFSEGNTTGSDSYVGGFCGRNLSVSADSSAIILHCESKGDTTKGSNFHTGGFCGSNEGEINKCHNTGTVEGKDGVGGFCGRNSGILSYCHTSSTPEGRHYVGGFCGTNYADNNTAAAIIDSCFATGIVKGNGYYVGGFCGYNSAKSPGTIARIDSCYSEGKAEGGGSYVGGFCGDNSADSVGSVASIKNCYSSGEAESTNGSHVGGFCGSIKAFNRAQTFIEKCYSTGKAIGKKAFVGGFCGRNYADSINCIAEIFDCYSTGEATSTGDSCLGGFCGSNGAFYEGSVAKISFCYSEGKSDGINKVGGFAGTNFARENGSFAAIDSCFSIGEVIGDTVVGGFCGKNQAHKLGSISRIDSCYSEGAVFAKGPFAGGFCGRNIASLNGSFSVIRQCRAAGNVTDTTDIETGGFCGNNFGFEEGSSALLTNCYSTGTVIGKGDVGGFCGKNSGSSGDASIDSCYSIGSVTGETNVGGFCGLNSSYYESSTARIDSCSCKGAVSGKLDQVGGFCGRNYAHEGNAEIVLSYTDNDTIFTGRAYVGGFCGSNTGFNTGSSAIIENCYTLGNALGTGNFVGGFCGRNVPNVENSYVGIEYCYSKGTAEGNYYVGGFCGANGYTGVAAIYNSRSDGNAGGSQFIGGFCGQNFTNTRYSYTVIDSCQAHGAVTGDQVIGGFCGFNQELDTLASCNIIDCFSTGAVTGDDWIGGFNGKNTGDISFSNSSGIVTANGNNFAGGFCGNNDGYLWYSYSEGNVNGTGISSVGGFCGSNSKDITGCYSKGGALLDFTSYNVGGFCGHNTGNIHKSYTSISSHVACDQRVGGFCATNNGVITNSYSRGNASAIGVIKNQDDAGGFCGRNTATITNCYSTGRAVISDYSDTTDFLGGFCAASEITGTVSNCYFDTLSSGLTVGFWGSPRSYSQMKTEANYAGWDFLNTWIIDNDYPTLIPKPEAPTNLIATYSDNIVELTWDASPTDDVTYNIYRRLSSEPYNSQALKTGHAVTSFNDSSAANLPALQDEECSVRYCYIVRAEKFAVESSRSNEDTVRVGPPDIRISHIEALDRFIDLPMNSTAYAYFRLSSAVGDFDADIQDTFKVKLIRAETEEIESNAVIVLDSVIRVTIPNGIVPDGTVHTTFRLKKSNIIGSLEYCSDDTPPFYFIRKVPYKFKRTFDVYAGKYAGIYLGLGSAEVPGASIAAAKISVTGEGGMGFRITTDQDDQLVLDRRMDYKLGVSLKAPSISLGVKNVIGTSPGIEAGMKSVILVGQTISFNGLNLSQDVVKLSQTGFLLETLSYGGAMQCPYASLFLVAVTKTLNKLSGASDNFDQAKIRDYVGVGCQGNISAGLSFKIGKMSISGSPTKGDLVKGSIMSKYSVFNRNYPVTSPRINYEEELTLAYKFNPSVYDFLFKIANDGVKLIDTGYGLYDIGDAAAISFKSGFDKNFNCRKLLFSYHGGAEHTNPDNLSEAKYIITETQIPERYINQLSDLRLNIAGMLSPLNIMNLPDMAVETADLYKELYKVITENPLKVKSKEKIANKIDQKWGVEFGLGLEISLGAKLGIMFKYLDEIGYEKKNTEIYSGGYNYLITSAGYDDSMRRHSFYNILDGLLNGALTFVKDEIANLVQNLKKTLQAGQQFAHDIYDGAGNLIGSVRGKLSRTGDMISSVFSASSPRPVISPDGEVVVRNIYYTSAVRNSHDQAKDHDEILTEKESKLMVAVGEAVKLSFIPDGEAKSVDSLDEDVELTMVIDTNKLKEAGFNISDTNRISLYRWDDSLALWFEIDSEKSADSLIAQINKMSSYALGIEVGNAEDTIAPEITEYGPPHNSVHSQFPEVYAIISDNIFGDGVNFSKTYMIINEDTVDFTIDFKSNKIYFQYDSVYTVSDGIYPVKIHATDLKGNFTELSFRFVYGNIQAPDEAPNLIYPADNGEVNYKNLEFLWTETGLATGYHMQLSNMIDFEEANLIINDSLLIEPNRINDSLDKYEKYYWRVRGLNPKGKGPWSNTGNFSTVLTSTSMKQNDNIKVVIKPNPAKDKSIIEYTLFEPSNVLLDILDQSGRIIISLVDDFKDIGRHSCILYADKFSSGTYFYRIKTDNTLKTGKLLIVK